MFRGELKAGEHRLSFGDVTYVMGVINLSPESKNAHTVAATPEEALSLADRYRAWGADLVEVGGQSSHYDNPTIEVDEEIKRVVPAVESLVADGHVVAVDTWKPAVAEKAIEAGAAIINDTSGLRSADMRHVLTTTEAAVIAVYVEGDDPHSVGDLTITPDKTRSLVDSFRRLIDELDPSLRSRVLVDPGIAINYRGDYQAYTRFQLDVIRQSSLFTSLERPLVIPIPRKADIHWVSAYITLALEYGADMIRVHDVAVAARLVRLWEREVDR
ncbi:MAG TPA: dihydropteroate synthase [Acidimicrobiia bacterium]|jgi:dihydropteroate synthase